jgi:hypothetical protein
MFQENIFILLFVVVVSTSPLLSRKMLSEVAFEQIKDNYYYGAYGEFRVIMDKSNGYVNATKMCSSGGKDYDKWSRLKSSHELIQTLENNMALENTHGNHENFENVLGDGNPQIWGLPSLPCKVVHTLNQTDQERIISGTYCHPDLVPSIAGWISPIFQLKANRVVNKFILEEYRVKLAASVQAVAILASNLQQSQQSLQTTQLALDSSTESNTILQGNINNYQAVVNFQNDIIEVKKEAVETMEEAIGEKTRERQIWASTHTFTLLKTNEDSPKHGFYVIRCQGRRVGTSIQKLRQKHQRAEVIFQELRVPNAVNLYTRLKAQKIVEHKHNYCTPTCTTQQLVYHLNNLCGST